MFCFIHKWFVSNALDMGKPVPASVQRHLDHCTSCKSFAHLSGKLGDRLTRDAREIRDLTPGSLDALNERITIVLAHQPSPGSEAETDLYTLARPRQTVRALRPALALAATVLVVVMGLSLFNSNTSNPVEPSALFQRVAAGKTIIPKSSIGKLALQMESPLNRELRYLKEAAVSTKDFLLSAVSIKLDTPSM